MGFKALSPQYVVEINDRNFRAARPGSIVGSVSVSGSTLYIVKNKDTRGQVLEAIQLTRENALQLISGIVPATTVLKKRHLGVVYS